ncbi:putative mitochondrial protein, partial [Trifolium pratense]
MSVPVLSTRTLPAPRQRSTYCKCRRLVVVVVVQIGVSVWWWWSVLVLFLCVGDVLSVFAAVSATTTSPAMVSCFVFVFLQTPIRSRSPLLTGSRLISLPLATKMFQFAKFEKSKERRLAAELGYGFPIGDPWITDGISPWPFASESVLPSQ